MGFRFPEAMTILSRSVVGQDADGNDIYLTSETDTSGAFAPEGSSELMQGENVVLDHPQVYLTAGAPVPAPTDQMRVRGEVYDIDGAPQVFFNPFTGDAPGPVVKLLGVT